MVEEYARYDYAWKTAGWTVQNPTVTMVSPNTYYDPGLPDDVSKVLVSGEFIDWDSGRELEGVVDIRTSKLLTYTTTHIQVMPGIKSFRFRGHFSILLPATDDPQLQPTGWTYQFRVTVAGYLQEFETVLPASPSTVNLLDLLPVS